ncbi:MAG: DUF4232 domain-containing protein [Candidatus Limnocylindrales bacterium]
MSSLTPEALRRVGPSVVGSGRLLATGVCLLVALAVAGCSSAAPTPIFASTSAVAGDTSTPTSTPAPTDTATPAPTAVPTATPTPTPPPTRAPTPTPTPTPLPALAIGLCTGAQLQLTFNPSPDWEGSSGVSYAHITATNVSSGSCNMRGTPRTQVVDGGGRVIADSGNAGAEISTGDPVYPLAPNGTINDIVTWSNWCKSTPSQKVTVAAVLPFGLGRLVAKPLNPAPIPTCYASGTASTVSAEAWLP